MSIKEAYDSWARRYDLDENLTRDLDRIIMEKTLGDSRLDKTIEIGCGTGKNTLFLSRISRTVHAIDFSEKMIKLAEERPNSGNVTFSITDITEKWPCKDQSAQFISCNLVLEHIENLSFIFSEAYRILTGKGRFFISELHPFRQYQGKKARFVKKDKTFEISAFVHNISEFINAAINSGFILTKMNEWHHPEEKHNPPRIVSFIFEKSGEQVGLL